jgi:hypothetical protein
MPINLPGTLVMLPWDKSVVFPLRCVSCDANPPSASVRVSAWRYLRLPRLLRIPTQRFVVDVPFCEACARRFRRGRRVRFAALLLSLSVGGTLSVWLLGDFTGTKFWLAALILAATSIPWFVCELYWIQAFDLMPYKEGLLYEFKNASYALEFTAINGGTLLRDDERPESDAVRSSQS